MPRPRGGRSADGDDSGSGIRDGYESPTLQVDADQATEGDAIGVVTRSMARRMKEQEVPPVATSASKALPIPVPRMPSTADSVGTAATIATPLSRGVSATSLDDEPPAPPPPPADDADNYGSPENHYRHVRRSPKFNYDRFIPA
ncbi:hypothetical protein IWQ57_004866, partial [Coemansia nantahalensis]